MTDAATTELVLTVKKKQAEHNRKKQAELTNAFTRLYPLHDETGNGQTDCFIRYAKDNKTPIAYCEEYGWTMYQQTASGGGYWLTNARVAVEKLYLEFCAAQLQALTNYSTIDDSKLKFIAAWRNTSRAMQTVIHFAESKTCVNADKFDSDPLLLNVQNGVINLKTGKLEPAKPEYYCRKICAVGYQADDEKYMRGLEKWLKVVGDITADNNGDWDGDLVSFLQELAGTCVTGKTMERLFIAYGSGGNGKSTIFETLRTVLGSYSISMTSDCLIEDKGRTNFDIVALDGVRFVVLTETTDGKTLNIGRMKGIITTGNIRAQEKYLKPYEFAPTHTAVMYSNNLPSVYLSDNGTWDRLRVIPFRQRIRDTEKDKKTMREELITDCGEAVLRWAIEGALTVIQGGYKLNEPEAVRQYSSRYKSKQSNVNEFMRDCCVTVSTGKEKTSKLYAAYTVYCDDNALEPVKKSFFKADILAATGETDAVTIHGQQYFKGVTLKNMIEGKNDET